MFRRSLDLKPDFAEAHYNLGNVLALQERIADAEQSL
jgi:Flp pilus assembly protein TadD